MATKTVVSIREGQVRGKEMTATSFTKKKYFAFQGIPYAQPPIGNLRFKGPVAVSAWQGVRDALEEAPSCPQDNKVLRQILGEEDNCLALNVYTPRLPEPGETSSMPVMVWFHGGGFTLGSGNIDMSDPEYWMEHNVVIVTCNYRVGVFDGLRHVEHCRRRMYLSIEGGAAGRLRNRPSSYIANDRRIREASQLLSENALTPLEFLLRACHSLASLTLADIENGPEEEENGVAAPDPPAHPLPELPADPAPLMRERRGRGGRRRGARPRRGRGMEGQFGNAEAAAVEEGHGQPAARGRGRGRGRDRGGRGGRGGRGRGRALVPAEAPHMEIDPDDPAPIAGEPHHAIMQAVWPQAEAGALSQRQQGILQEINVNAEEDAAAEEGELACITCGANRRAFMVDPCGHFVMCGACTIIHRRTIAESNGIPLPIRCPMCRGTVINYKRVFQ